MAYTIKKVAQLSAVSVRTLHFYDEIGLLKPAYHASNGYRIYEEAQLLTLQQILFYRELGFPLKQIRSILGQPDFERVAALHGHREVLEESLARTRRLLDTIDKTARRMNGAYEMTDEELFAGFTVAAGKDRFDAPIRLGGDPQDCKLSTRDTDGALSIFEFAGTGAGPRHRHREQDEWIYVLDGAIELELDGRRTVLAVGESAYIPRLVAHGWASIEGAGARVLDIYRPAGTMEHFFRKVGGYNDAPAHEALLFDEFCQLFAEHGMDLLGPPLNGSWHVTEDGRMSRLDE
jgi:DNA-binding transcriptional MerR regulator